MLFLFVRIFIIVPKKNELSYSYYKRVVISLYYCCVLFFCFYFATQINRSCIIKLSIYFALHNFCVLIPFFIRSNYIYYIKYNIYIYIYIFGQYKIKTFTLLLHLIFLSFFLYFFFHFFSFILTLVGLFLATGW